MSHNHIATARRVLDVEARAVAALGERVSDTFEQACELLLACKGRVIVTGMGKSGHIGSKLAATLASTGTPSFFVHPGEASHGDLGMITTEDAVLALSNSGETGEILTIIPVIKRKGAVLISMTGRPSSSLAQLSDVHLDVGVEEEACPHNLAPTTSTTAALAMGDALAIALLEARGFTAEDFALSHPGGSLGRRLLLKVDDIMHAEERLPRVSRDASLSDALLEMTRKGLGMTTVVDDDGRLIGIFTDGDLRRTLEKGLDIRQAGIADVMSPRPVTMPPGHLAAEALQIMETRKINGLVVCDADQRPVGALNTQDLLRAGGDVVTLLVSSADARNLKLMAFDVDGVLTDGRLYYGPDGEALKVFNTLDGHGLKKLAASGVTLALITGRDTPMVARRAAELGIQHVIQGREDKGVALADLAASLGVTARETGYAGDDEPDVPALQWAQIAFAPSSGHDCARAAADHVTRARGGEGAVREICDALLEHRGDA